jgi:hypothetical protein
LGYGEQVHQLQADLEQFAAATNDLVRRYTTIPEARPEAPDLV